MIWSFCDAKCSFVFQGKRCLPLQRSGSLTTDKTFVIFQFFHFQNVLVIFKRYLWPAPLGFCWSGGAEGHLLIGRLGFDSWLLYSAWGSIQVVLQCAHQYVNVRFIQTLVVLCLNAFYLCQWSMLYSALSARVEKDFIGTSLLPPCLFINPKYRLIFQNSKDRYSLPGT